MKQSRKAAKMTDGRIDLRNDGACTVGPGSSVYAAEKDEVDEALRGFTLDQIIVTATRDEKRDVDVPASTEVLTRDDIKKTGATNAAGAISKLQGLQYKSFGVAGASMGTMINEASIRGVDSGTLVMVNGNTIAWRGKYNLEAIQADEIKRESKLARAMALYYTAAKLLLIINIITKKKADNYVKAGIGNYGRKSYGASVGNDKIQVSYENEKWDKKIDKITEHSGVSYTPKGGTTKEFGETKTAINHVRRENIGLNYNINDNLSLNYHYFRSQADYIRNVTGLGPDVKDMKVGDLFNNRLYTTKQHVTQLNYKR